MGKKEGVAKKILEKIKCEEVEEQHLLIELLSEIIVIVNFIINPEVSDLSLAFDRFRAHYILHP